MRVLIIGASGLIGGNILRLFDRELNWNVVGTFFSFQAKNCVFYNTLNPSDPDNHDVSVLKPEIVVHCGALTFVDYCEEHDEESFNKTVQSTLNALDLAKKYEAKFIYISTDYIFNGQKGPYFETDEVNPVSVYGKHKLAAEQAVISSGLNHLIIRVTNVYGDEERGKNFIARLSDTALKGIEAEMSFPVDQFATPVNAADVAGAIAELINAEKSGIYNISSTDYVNRYQLAMMVLKHYPHNRIKAMPVLTAALSQPAERPLNGGLISAKFLKEFPEFCFSNVDDYLKTKLND